jgi:hypothetical protein
LLISAAAFGSGRTSILPVVGFIEMLNQQWKNLGRSWSLRKSERGLSKLPLVLVSLLFGSFPPLFIKIHNVSHAVQFELELLRFMLSLFGKKSIGEISRAQI